MKPWFDDLPLDWTRQDTRTAEKLLIGAFPTNYEALMLAQSAGLDLAALNQTAPVKILMNEIMKRARLSGRLLQLLAEVLGDADREAIHPQLRQLLAGYEGAIIAAAMRRKPSLSTLAMLPPSIEIWGGGNVTPQPAGPGFEKLINAAAGFSDPALFRMRLAEAEVRTARIDIGGKPNGTGFLVGDSLLLTNWHVVSGLIQGGTAVFDNKVSALGKGEQDAGRKVPFAADWLVASSLHEATAVEVGQDGPPVGSWDFAVVRLAEAVGAQAIGPDPQASGDPRGRYVLDGSDYLFEAGEPIFILGHPSGRPVQFSYASPSQAVPTKWLNRVRYKTNTEGGSSGSPVFNRDWRIVALHHAAGPTAIPGILNLQTNDFNQGIPVSGIVTQLKTQLAGRPEFSELGLA